MSPKLLFYITILLILHVFLLNGFTQEYTQWHLPDGAEARLGKGSINDVTFSPDGKLLAVATSIGVWIYDAQTGKEISLIKVNFRSPLTIHRVAFSPDGEILATGNWVLGGNIELWDVKTSEKIVTLKENIGRVYKLEFSPDGKMLSCGSWYRKVEYHMWEVGSGREVASFTGDQHGYSAFVQSSGSRLIAVAGEGKIFLWDVRAKSLRHALDNPTRFAEGLAFSPDNKTLASSGMDVILWDTETGNQISKLEQSQGVSTLTYSPNGKLLAGGGFDGKIILWDIEQRNKQPKDRKLSLPSLLRDITNKKPSNSKNTTLEGHTLPIETFAFTDNSKTLASGSKDGTVIVWDVTSKTKRFTIHGHIRSMHVLRFLENGKTLFSGSSDGTVRVWNTDIETEQIIKPKWNTFPIAFSQDGKIAASRSRNSELQIWDVDADSLIHAFNNSHQRSVNVLALSPDGRFLASGSRDGTIELWDVPTRQHFSSLDRHTDDVNAVLFSPDGRLFASASEDGTVQLWDIQTGKKAVLITDANRGVRALAFAPDSKTLVSGRWDGPIQIWDTTTFQHIGDFINAAGTVDALEFSPDGKILANGLYGLIRLWDVNTKTKIQEIYKAHNNSVTKFAFTPDSKTLVSGSSDGTILIWDLEKMGIGNR